MRAYRIYLIRHGITQANYEGRYVGSTDVPLCDEGVYELVKLMQECEYPNVGGVYTSPLKRCIQTAKILYKEHTPISVDGLREYDFGEFENKTIAELKDDERYIKFISSNWIDGPEKAEKMQDFHDRVLEGMNSIILDMMKRKTSDVAVVAHGGVIMQLLSACGLPERKASDWGVGNGRGYTLLINASLWGNTRKVEVFTTIPYGDEKTSEVLGYGTRFNADE